MNRKSINLNVEMFLVVNQTQLSTSPRIRLTINKIKLSNMITYLYLCVWTYLSLYVIVKIWSKSKLVSIIYTLWIPGSDVQSVGFKGKFLFSLQTTLGPIIQPEEMNISIACLTSLVLSYQLSPSSSLITKSAINKLLPRQSIRCGVCKKWIWTQHNTLQTLKY